MPLVYRSKWTFTNEAYCRSVCGIAFSPDGLYLAYGSSENLCILDVLTKRLIIVIRGRGTSKGPSHVTSLMWSPNESFHLVVTFQDGVIASITRSSDRRRLSLDGIDTLIQGISCIAIDPTGMQLAVGHESGVSIFSNDLRQSWLLTKELGAPHLVQENTDAAVEIVGIHWLGTKGERLIVAYRSHGVHGRSSLSPDSQTLALAMQSGYHIHHLDQRVAPFSIPHDMSGPGPILFVHGGVALLGTTRKGEICLWSSSDGEKLQTMKQSTSDNWRYLAAHDATSCLLATATKRKISLWEAVEEDSIINYVSRSAGIGAQLGGGWIAPFLFSLLLTVFLNLLFELKIRS